MERVFLEILAEEARNPNNTTSSFGSSSLNRVASTIFEMFKVQCEHKHVENHLKTVKGTWTIICMLREKSGFGWDHNIKMITCDRSTYEEAVTEDLQNLIKMLIAHMIDTNDIEEMTTDTFLAQSSGGKSTSSNVGSSQGVKRKRRLDDTVIEGLVEEIGNVAKAIAKFNKVDDDAMFAKVMSVGEGYDERELGKVFEFLMRNETEARIFNAKSDNLKKIWIEEFLLSRLD
ncbi:hypothetical protein DM860_014991 [Cuscuta australis]|uniref:Myb/SANT-like domain-containing protein n=1 Tax=Cuscuta australis TaxID=267555 RepID=A0A328DFK5_9ASTE|nr:hypothetical protein DM860_014991 [Cuscuta australis]